MQGWKFLRHSWLQVTQNRGQMFIILAVPFSIQIVFGILLVGSMGAYSVTPWFAEFGSERVMLISGIAIVLTSVWIAVAWHRFILLSEQPDGYFSYPNGRRVNEYFWRMMLSFLGLIMVAGIFWVILLYAAEFVGFGADPTTRIAILILPLILVVYLFLRMSPYLTAIAVGKTISIGEAWQATKGSGSAIIVILLVVGGYQVAVEALIFPLIGANMVTNILYDIVTSWIDMMIWITLLTTFYGHYVEGRELV